MDINFKDMFSGMLPKRTKERRVTVAEARDKNLIDDRADSAQAANAAVNEPVRPDGVGETRPAQVVRIDSAIPFDPDDRTANQEIVAAGGFLSRPIGIVITQEDPLTLLVADAFRIPDTGRHGMDGRHNTDRR